MQEGLANLLGNVEAVHSMQQGIPVSPDFHIFVFPYGHREQRREWKPLEMPPFLLDGFDQKTWEWMNQLWIQRDVSTMASHLGIVDTVDGPQPRSHLRKANENMARVHRMRQAFQRLYPSTTPDLAVEPVDEKTTTIQFHLDLKVDPHVQTLMTAYETLFVALMKVYQLYMSLVLRVGLAPEEKPVLSIGS
jgi:hypothetical protein